MRHRSLDDFGVGRLFDTEDQGVSAPPPMGGLGAQILFVCTANISRSPYAELLTRHLLGPGTPWAVMSAGVPGTRGRAIDPQMSSQAQRRGVPASWCDSHRSQPVSAELLAQSSIIVTMTKQQRDAVLDLEPGAHPRLFTCHQIVAAARLASDSVERLELGAGMVDVLRARVPIASRRHDVPDPYRQSSDVADKAAAHIDVCVGTLISFLRSVRHAAC